MAACSCSRRQTLPLMLLGAIGVHLVTGLWLSRVARVKLALARPLIGGAWSLRGHHTLTYMGHRPVGVRPDRRRVGRRRGRSHP